MRLVADDHKQIYYWADDNNPDLSISPHFDYLEDAMQWKENQQKNIWDQFNKPFSPDAYK